MESTKQNAGKELEMHIADLSDNEDYRKAAVLETDRSNILLGCRL